MVIYFNIDKCIQVCLVTIIVNGYSCLLLVCCHFVLCTQNTALLQVHQGAHACTSIKQTVMLKQCSIILFLPVDLKTKTVLSRS